MGAGGLFFMIDDDMMKLLPSDLDSKISWDDIQNEFGSTELIYIAFGKKGESVFNTKSFSTLWELTKSLEQEDQIEEVASLSNISRIDNVDDFMEVDNLQTDRNLTSAQIAEIKIYLEKNPTIKKRFISEDEEYFAIYAQPYGNKTFDLFSKVVVDKTNDILKGYEIHYGECIHIWDYARSYTKRCLQLNALWVINNGIHPALKLKKRSWGGDGSYGDSIITIFNGWWNGVDLPFHRFE